MSRHETHFEWLSDIFRASSFFADNKKLFCLNRVILHIFSVLVFLAVYNICFLHQNVFEIAACCQSISSHWLLFIRHWLLIKYSSLVDSLIKDSRLCWNYDLFGENLADRLRRRCSLYVRILKCLRGVSAWCWLILAITPLISDDANLPLAAWIPGSSTFLSVVIYILQIICFAPIVTSIVVYDGTFLLTCAELENQFILLKERIRSIKLGEDCTMDRENSCLENLKTNTLYHCFLLRMHDKLQTFGSSFLLVQFLMISLVLCALLFLLQESQDILIGVVYAPGVLLQVATTFIAVSNVEIEAESLTEAIYEIDWYNAKTIKFRQHILFMMIRTQQPLRLSGGGMFDVDRSRLVQILRISFSSFTLLKDLNS